MIIYWICGFAFAFGKNKYAEVGDDGETIYKYSSANSFIGRCSRTSGLVVKNSGLVVKTCGKALPCDDIVISHIKQNGLMIIL